MIRQYLMVVGSVLLWSAGCGGEIESTFDLATPGDALGHTDGMVSPDGSTPADGPTPVHDLFLDSSIPLDVFVAPDSWIAPDISQPVDSGPPAVDTMPTPDSASPVDSALPIDMAPAIDAGIPADATVDVAPAVDATVDVAPAVDATVDAAPVIDGTVDAAVAPDAQPACGPVAVTDNFSGNGQLLNYTTNNPNALPDVTRSNGRYRANLTSNAGEITLHFHGSQGRLDAKLVCFPFEYIARNIGIGTQANSQNAPPPTSDPYLFAGIQVHVQDLNQRNSSHIVVGHRGGAHYTIEGKNTVWGSSSVNDIGAYTVPDGRADIRIVGNAQHQLTFYWQTPSSNPGVNPDNWTLYNGTGKFPGTQPTYGAQVYIGLITYAFLETGVPFVGTCDSVELVGE